MERPEAKEPGLVHPDGHDTMTELTGKTLS